MSSNAAITRARALVAEFYETALAEADNKTATALLNAHTYVRMERWYLLASVDLANDLYVETISLLGSRDFVINGVSYLQLVGGFNDNEYSSLSGSVSKALGWVRKLKVTDTEVAERGFRLEARELDESLPWFVFVYLWSTLPVPEVDGIERPNRTQ